MFYFAYGSNLNRDDLNRWSRERNLPAIALDGGIPALLPDRRLAFTHRSTTRGGGVLDVPPSIGCAVSGIVFDVADNAIPLLDLKEGSGHTYGRIDAIALTSDGRELLVFTYEVEPSHREPFVAPPIAYLDVVRRGYEVLGLALASLEAAARRDAHPGPVTRLFVYGTLMRGEERHGALLRHGARFTSQAYVRGTLFDCGPYPALSPDGSEVPVAGELYEAPDLGALLTEADRIEGFRGFGVMGSLYRRAIVLVETGAGPAVLAWTYLLAGDSGGARVIPGGDWRGARARPVTAGRRPHQS